ncbi:hypothetical protein LC147_11785 [Vibrio harveyi]|uniref:winged helix-turn-helix transcriptional regulator n=1 Tax=Vibrio harveyi TaxID=669 RepID=UPI003BB77828
MSVVSDPKAFVAKNAGKMKGKDIAKALGKSYAATAMIASALGVSLVVPVVSDKDVDLMRELHEDYQISFAELARKFGISPAHARAICVYEARLGRKH